jgi:hypothetical protein
LDEWRIDVTDVMGNDDLVVATVRLVARRGDIRVDTTGAHVFRFDPNGTIAEAWGVRRRSESAGRAVPCRLRLRVLFQ